MNQKHDRSAQHAPSAIDYCRTLNVFRHTLTPDLYCVVPEDCPVPVFVAGDDWRFVTDAGEATLQQSRRMPLRPPASAGLAIIRFPAD
jgi:hypothetical protein